MSTAQLSIISPPLFPKNLEPNQPISKIPEEKHRNQTIQYLVKVLAVILAIEILTTIIAFFTTGTPAICLIILGSLILATILCIILLVVKVALSTKPQGQVPDQQV